MAVVTDPRVNRDELLASLNTRCAELGVAPVDARVLRSWIAKGLIAGPHPIGRRRGLNPEWTYQTDTLRAALRIVELRASGVHRVTLLRLYLWVEGAAYSSDNARRALVTEFKRFVKRNRR